MTNNSEESIKVKDKMIYFHLLLGGAFIQFKN